MLENGHFEKYEKNSKKAKIDVMLPHIGTYCCLQAYLWGIRWYMYTHDHIPMVVYQKEAVQCELVDLTAVDGKNMLKIDQISSFRTAHQNIGVFKRGMSRAKTALFSQNSK